MKNILTEALVNSATNASFIFSYTNSAKLRILLAFYKIFLKAIHIPYKNPPKLMGVFVIISYVSLKIK